MHTAGTYPREPGAMRSGVRADQHWRRRLGEAWTPCLHTQYQDHGEPTGTPPYRPIVPLQAPLYWAISTDASTIVQYGRLSTDSGAPGPIQAPWYCCFSTDFSTLVGLRYQYQPEHPRSANAMEMRRRIAAQLRLGGTALQTRFGTYAAHARHIRGTYAAHTRHIRGETKHAKRACLPAQAAVRVWLLALHRTESVVSCAAFALHWHWQGTDRPEPCAVQVVCARSGVAWQEQERVSTRTEQRVAECQSLAAAERASDLGSQLLQGIL
eukprot:2606067-Rhodomonas_salina.1